MKLLITIGISVGVYLVVHLVSSWLKRRGARSENKLDDILIPILSTIAKIIVIAIAAVYIGDEAGLDVKSILAGLGIGGLALAMAAKDTLAHAVAAVSIILDRPFEIGDEVNLGGSIDGKVEQIGLRSTRLSYPRGEIIIPNSKVDSYVVQRKTK